MPFSWSDLAGVVTRPPAPVYADYSGAADTILRTNQLIAHQQAAEMQAAQQAQALQQRAAQAAAAEQGRRERAMLRAQQSDAKLALERERMQMGHSDKEGELFRAAQVALEEAVRRGDPVAIDIAQQHLRQLGYDVSGGSQAAPIPTGTGPVSSALTGRPELIPQPQAQAFAGPPATSGVPKREVNLGALDAAAKTQGRPINQGLPSAPHQTSPSPVNDKMNASKQQAQVAAQPPALPPQAPQAPPVQAGPPPGPQPIIVRKDTKELLRLGAPGVDQTGADEYFKPLLEGATSAEERRAARIAQQTAREVAAREGIEKAREAGTKAYQFELNRLRKGFGASGGVGGAPDYGGTGMSKAEYTVSEKDNAQARHIVDKSLQEAHVTKLADSQMAFQQMLGNLSANSNLGNLGALKSYIKTTDDRISDADFRLAAGTGGAWNTIHQKLQYYLSLPDTTQMTPEFLKEIRATAQAGLGALNSRKKEIAGQLSRRLAGAEDLSPSARQRWSKSAWSEVGADEPSGGSGGGSGASGQGSLYDRLRLTGK